jgi:hypothetical protein
MIRLNIIVSCMAALGIDEKGSGCIFSTLADNKATGLSHP